MVVYPRQRKWQNDLSDGERKEMDSSRESSHAVSTLKKDRMDVITSTWS